MDEENKVTENEQIAEEKIKSYDKELKFAGAGLNVNPEHRNIVTMTDAEYVKERLDGQMDWYDNRAKSFQRKYKKIRRWEIIIAASIPVLIGFAAMSFLENTVPLRRKLYVSKWHEPFLEAYSIYYRKIIVLSYY